MFSSYDGMAIAEGWPNCQVGHLRGWLRLGLRKIVLAV